MTDPIADYLTRIRNAIMASATEWSRFLHRTLKKAITKILYEKGYILNYKFIDSDVQGSIKIALKYDTDAKVAAIKALKRVSTPRLRKYAGFREIPRVLNGLGIAILSTSKGVMTDKEAFVLLKLVVKFYVTFIKKEE